VKDPAGYLLGWPAQDGMGASGAYDVLSGLLDELWADSDFSRAACAAPVNASADLLVDAPAAGSEYWLVRARNNCEKGGYGVSGAPLDARAPLNTPPADTPCP
jgi:hypothetical protein